MPLCIDALKAAVAEAKRGRDTQRYREAVECLRLAGPSEPEAEFDQTWLEATEKSNRTETQRLITELKGYKNNLIKESIRVTSEPPITSHLPCYFGVTVILTTPVSTCRWETRTWAGTTRASEI